MDEEYLPPLSPDESREFARRRRGRNVALLVVLLAVVALFYAISFVKFKVH